MDLDKIINSYDLIEKIKISDTYFVNFRHYGANIYFSSLVRNDSEKIFEVYTTFNSYFKEKGIEKIKNYLKEKGKA